MSQSIVHAGVCGCSTTVRAEAGPSGAVALSISSDCPSVQRLAQQLTEVDPLREITYHGEAPLVLEVARACLPHPACIVPAAILKTIEVAAGLALPSDATIRLARDES